MLAEGSGNIVDVIKNLQTVVSTLRDSNVQIVAFQNRLATLTSVINDSSSDLDGAIANLSVAIGEVKRFIAETRDPTSEQIQRLGNVTQILVDNKTALENVLHISPTAFANGYNIYNPDTGDFGGGFTLPNFSSPAEFVCGSIAAIENVTAAESGKLCAQYLGPALRLLNFNYIPIPTNPYLMRSANPNNIVYADPSLAPGGPGPVRPPEDAPAISAYTGLNNDVGAPENYGQPPAIAPGPGRRTSRMHRRILARAVAGPGGADGVEPAGHADAGRDRPGPRSVVRRAAPPAAVPPGPPCPRKGHRDAQNFHPAAARRGLRRAADLGLRVPGPELAATAGCGRPRSGREHLPRRTRQRRHAGIEFAGADERRRDRQRRCDEAQGLARRRRDPVKPDVGIPANAVATVGQTSLLGSMHVALRTPLGQAPSGRLVPGATIPLKQSSKYPSTEQTLSRWPPWSTAAVWVRSATSSITSARRWPAARATSGTC